jgi:hypothetical protein
VELAVRRTAEPVSPEEMSRLFQLISFLLNREGLADPGLAVGLAIQSGGAGFELVRHLYKEHKVPFDSVNNDGDVCILIAS